MSQGELAAVSGLSQATVSHAMTGRAIDLGTVRKLARALTVTPALPGAAAIVGAQDGSATKGQLTPAEVVETRP